MNITNNKANNIQKYTVLDRNEQIMLSEVWLSKICGGIRKTNPDRQNTYKNRHIFKI